MELTAEQKFLKALAEWLDIETIPKNRIQEASREYLDQFTDSSKKVDECDEPEPTWTPVWKPEVGRLYQRKSNGAITEITSLKGNRVRHVIKDFDYDPDVENSYHEDSIRDFCAEYDHIAELEGLEESDSVWCIAGSGVTEYYTIESVFSHNLTAYCGKGYVSVYFDGSACMFGNGTQLFWRTADRAERFGKVDK